MTSFDDRNTQKHSLACAKKLLDALTKEYDALVNNDLDALVTAIEDKSQAVSQLRQIEEVFIKQGRLDLRDTATHNTEGGPWRDFRKVMNQCRHQNIVNGRIIHMRQHSTNTALSILRGQEHIQQAAYSADGKPVSAPAPTRIATA